MKTPKFIRALAFVFALGVTFVIADGVSSGMQAQQELA